MTNSVSPPPIGANIALDMGGITAPWTGWLQELRGATIGAQQTSATNTAAIAALMIPKCYGVFHDNTTQTAAAINTAYPIVLGGIDLSVGVTIGTPTSRVYVARDNVYNFQFSLQLYKASAALKGVWIWCRINGTDVEDSATLVSVGGSGSGVVAAWNFVLALAAGNYFELVWSTEDTGCQIKSWTATAPVPGIPSVILTVTDNIK